MYRKSKTLMATILIFCLLLTGCGGATGFLETETDGPLETIVSNEVSIPMEKVRTLNPVITRDEEAYFLNKLLYQGLFDLDKTLTPVPVLADTYKYSEDGKTVTIALKKGIKWQDGTSFTAEDVKFSIDAYMSVYNPAVQSVYAPSVALIQSAKIDDNGRIVITFKNPLNASVANLTFPIIPSGTAKKAAAVQSVTDDFVPVGTGPYMVSATDPGKQITLVGNPEYEGTVPKNTLLIKYIPSKEEAVNLFDVREYNMTFLKEGDRDAILSEIDAKVHSFPSNEAEFLGFNFRNEILKDRRVRQAVACALDPEKIIDSCYFGSGVTNDTVYFPNYLGVKTAKPLYECDVDQAKTILAGTGYTDLSFRLLVSQDNGERMLAAQMIKESLAQAGITIEIVPVEAASFAGQVASGSYDIFLAGYKIKETYDLRPFLRTGQNPIGYTNQMLDTLLDQMQSGCTAEEREKTFAEIRTILREEVPYYCLLYKTYGIAASPDLQGEVFPTFRNIYGGCETWSLTYEKTTVTEE